MKRMLFIVNPTAGQKKVNRFLPEIVSIFNAGGYEVTIYTTTASGDATRIARERGDKFDIIVCAGGDGTLNETISGVLSAGLEVPVGYIPAGSTNDFAASLGLSANIPQAARDIVEGEPVPYDVGKFGDRYFTYVASFGAFTRASYATPQNVKNALGHVAYVLEGIQEIRQIRKTHVRFELEDETIQEDDYIFGAVSNSTSIGGLITLDASQVDMGDGKLELLLVRAPRDMTELGECVKALQTQKYNCGMITFRSVPRLTIFPNPEMVWTLDGEKAEGQAEIQVTNLHHAFRLMTPKKEQSDA